MAIFLTCTCTHTLGSLGSWLNVKGICSRFTYWTDRLFGPWSFCGGKLFAHVRRAFLVIYLVCPHWSCLKRYSKPQTVNHQSCLLTSSLSLFKMNPTLSPNYKVHYHHNTLANHQGLQDTSKHVTVSLHNIEWSHCELMLAVHNATVRVWTIYLCHLFSSQDCFKILNVPKSIFWITKSLSHFCRIIILVQYFLSGLWPEFLWGIQLYSSMQNTGIVCDYTIIVSY